MPSNPRMPRKPRASVLYFDDIEVGYRSHVGSYLLTRDEVVEVAQRWDPQPFHTDEEEAKKWPLGLTASSVHSYAICARLATTMSDQWPAVVAALGVDEMRMPLPLRPGTCNRR